MGNPNDSVAGETSEKVASFTTTTFSEPPPPYTAFATTSSSNAVINTAIPPSYNEHAATKKQHVITVVHGSALPPVRVVHLQSFGADPAIVRCPTCGFAGESKIHREGGTMMWAWVCVLFWFVFWPCSWIPCVMDDCKDVHHECPNCGTHLGQMTRC